MNKRFLLIGFIILVLAVTLFFYFKRDKKEVSISTTGVVEGTEVSLSSKVSGRISEFCCKEGDKVNAGHTVVRLESDDIKASVEQAKAGVLRFKADITSAEAAVKNSEANLRSSEADIKNAEAELERAGVQMQEAERQMHRAELLYANEYISNAEVELAMTSHDSSKAASNAAYARLNAAISKKDAAASQLNSSESLLTSARARLKEAEAALKFQEARLKDTEIVTPISGTVVFKAMESGEVIAPGVVMLTVVDMENLWVHVDLEETLVGYVKIGEEVSIGIDGMSGKDFKGVVAEIGREADFATLKDVTRGRQDIKTFRVKIKTEDKTGTLKPGMTVMVEMRRKG